MARHRVLLLGAGKIGTAIATFLTRCGDYEVTVADAEQAAVGRVADKLGVRAIRLNVADAAALDGSFRGVNSVVSALSFTHNSLVAEAALRAGASYFDLTEDVETTRRVRAIAGQARDGQIFMPQCGLAPGFVAIVAHSLTAHFDTLDTLLMRVGALPMYPSNALKYNLTWSTDGLINEYCNPCEAIVDGRKVEVQALEGLESFSVDGVRYEAFNTSGGLGTLCDTLDGKVRSLNYKTVRYTGHRHLAEFLVNELRMRDDRDNLRAILERAVPMTAQDVVIVFCTATGHKDGRLVQVTDARKVYHGKIDGEPWSAIQITTAAGLCAVVDLHASGKLPVKRGMVRQEEVPLREFLANRFGRYYAFDGAEAVAVERVQARIDP